MPELSGWAIWVGDAFGTFDFSLPFSSSTLGALGASVGFGVLVALLLWSSPGAPWSCPSPDDIADESGTPLWDCMKISRQISTTRNVPIKIGLLFFTVSLQESRIIG